MPNHDENTRQPMDAPVMAPVEPWEVNEQLLLTSLREHAEVDQLQYLLAFSRAMASSLTEGICALDPSGAITFLNTAAERMLGWDEIDAQGLQAHDVLHGPNADRDPESFSVSSVPRSDASDASDHTVFARKDGTTFPVAYSVVPLVIGGQTVGTVVAFSDLTEVHRLQAIQEEYLALMSHDLRTPLTAIIGYADLLRNQLQEAALERATRSATAIVASGKQMDYMLRELLERNRLQVGQSILQLATVDLVDLVEHIIDNMMQPADRARIQFEAFPDISVVADALQLERVIVNLLSNACKYSSATAPVDVRVSKMGENAVISITDHGVGIDTDELPYIFEKYYRAKTAATTHGSGLGLYGSRLIVQAHGGRMWATSIAGVSSTFSVSIPSSGACPSANEFKRARIIAVCDVPPPTTDHRPPTNDYRPPTTHHPPPRACAAPNRDQPNLNNCHAEPQRSIF